MDNFIELCIIQLTNNGDLQQFKSDIHGFKLIPVRLQALGRKMSGVKSVFSNASLTAEPYGSGLSQNSHRELNICGDELPD